MSSEFIEECLDTESVAHTYQLDDYESGIARWCSGCGDYAILTALQRILRDNQIDPESVVCVSGIGCSSRFPHYLNTYGFHGIHGRALPISTGISLARPDLKVLTVMGDGDCCSIGSAHWLHTIRYNANITVLMFDNEIYALTKNQVSPTTREGAKTNTTPRGAYLKQLNPLSLMMGITNISFLAQTATWLPTHMNDTLIKAWNHNGLSFVRILQYCPVFTPNVYGKAGKGFPVRFLENVNSGIPVTKAISKYGPSIKHDHTDIHQAQEVSVIESPAPLGLIYHNPEVPTYEEIRHSRAPKIDRDEYLKRLGKLLDKFAIQ